MVVTRGFKSIIYTVVHSWLFRVLYHNVYKYFKLSLSSSFTFSHVGSFFLSDPCRNEDMNHKAEILWSSIICVFNKI